MRITACFLLVIIGGIFGAIYQAYANIQISKPNTVTALPPHWGYRFNQNAFISTDGVAKFKTVYVDGKRVLDEGAIVPLYWLSLLLGIAGGLVGTLLGGVVNDSLRNMRARRWVRKQQGKSGDKSPYRAVAGGIYGWGERN